MKRTAADVRYFTNEADHHSRKLYGHLLQVQSDAESVIEYAREAGGYKLSPEDRKQLSNAMRALHDLHMECGT